MEIGEVRKGLVEGKMFRRSCWQEEHFIFRQVPAEIPAGVVPNMQSLPDSVKKFFLKTFNDVENYQIDAIYYNDQIAYVGFSNSIKGYAFTPEDVLADDWTEFEG